MRNTAAFSVLIFVSLALLIALAAMAQEGRSGLPDSDNDGVPDESDLCPNDPNYAELQLSHLFTFRGVDGGFELWPMSVALDGTGRIYVSEGNTMDRVQVFSSDGSFIYSIDSGGSGPLSVPRVAVGPGGRIFVTETYRYRVQVFDEDGGWLYSVGAVNEDLFHQPSGIAVDSAGNFHLNDDAQVKVFDNDGTFLRAFGGRGVEPGQFSSPQGIDVDEVGRIYVADTFNQRVQVFKSPSGFLFEFGSYGTGDGEFDRPHDVTAGGYIFVSDRHNDRVQGFDAQGGFLGSFPGSGPILGRFDRPWGLVFDPASSRLYVGDVAPIDGINGIGGVGRVQVMEVSPPDTDADGIPDCEDPCPEDPDNDGDGYGMLGQCPPGPADCNDDSSDCNVECIDDDGDGLMVCAGDCDDSNPNCLWDCTDGDGDGYCVDVDCDDGAAGCTTVCLDEDEDGVLACAGDCDDQAPYCAADCTNADGDFHCADQDCDDANPYCSCTCVDNDQDGWCPPDYTCDVSPDLVDCDDSDPRCISWADCDDWDGDWVRNCSDCDQDDSSSWSPPAEVTGIEMDHVGGNPGTTTLTWSPPQPMGGSYVRYDVLRSISPRLFTGGVADCIETEIAVTTADDSGPIPGGGQWFFSYLVRARHGCQGTAGSNSGGSPRPTIDCD